MTIRLATLKRFAQFHAVPTSQASLALGMIGLGHAWAMYVPELGKTIQPLLASIGALLLIPVLLKYLLNRNIFFSDIKSPLTGSLMAPMSMGLLILCDYLAEIIPIIAYPLWFSAQMLHIFMAILFFYYQIKNFKISHIVPSWFLYPVGLISSSLAGTQFGHTLYSETITSVCIAIYFFMLPLVLYRLVFEGMLKKRARPTIAIMAAPINLSLSAYLVNFSEPDPILTGALAGIAITMTLLIYLCYFRLLRLKFQPSIAAITFPSVISSIAMYRLTAFFEGEYPHWYWLHNFGFFELSVATLAVIWVSIGFTKMYWPELMSHRQKKV